jgi:chromate transporter
VDLWTLFLICLKVSLLSFGGTAPLPLLQDELGRQRGLLTDDDFALALAIGRVSPGPAGLFVLPVGYFTAGLGGAVVAGLAQAVVALGVLGLLRAHTWLAHVAAVRDATRAIQVATAGLLLAVGYLILWGTVRSPLDAAVAAIACGLLLGTRLDVLLVLAAAAGLGLAGALLGWR